MLVTKPIKIDTGSDDRHGLLVFKDELLIAILVRLEDRAHTERQGLWHFEAIFGTSTKSQPVFDEVETALRWLEMTRPVRLSQSSAE